MITRLLLSPRLRLGISIIFTLVTIWSMALYDLHRSRASELGAGERIAVFQAHAFAENAHSTIKRVNEIALDLRTPWISNRAGFSDLILLRQEHTEDIAFQVSIIGAEGCLEYSNLAATNDRVFLGEREYFRVHRDAGGRDFLFISKPVKGKVSGKWSIQFTRPILLNNRFMGVLLISVVREQETVNGTHLPIIAITANALTGDKKRCLASGMDDCLAKLFNRAELFQALARLGNEAANVPLAIDSQSREA